MFGGPEALVLSAALCVCCSVLCIVSASHVYSLAVPHPYAEACATPDHHMRMVQTALHTLSNGLKVSGQSLELACLCFG